MKRCLGIVLSFGILGMSLFLPAVQAAESKGNYSDDFESYTPYNASDAGTYAGSQTGKSISDSPWSAVKMGKNTWGTSQLMYFAPYPSDLVDASKHSQVLTIMRAGGPDSITPAEWKAPHPSLNSSYKISYEFHRPLITLRDQARQHPLYFNISADGNTYYELNNYGTLKNEGGRPFGLIKVVNGQRTLVCSGPDNWSWAEGDKRDTWYRVEATVINDTISFQIFNLSLPDEQNPIEHGSYKDPEPLIASGDDIRIVVGNSTAATMYIDNFKVESLYPYIDTPEPGDVVYRDMAQEAELSAGPSGPSGLSSLTDGDPETKVSFGAGTAVNFALNEYVPVRRVHLSGVQGTGLEVTGVTSGGAEVALAAADGNLEFVNNKTADPLKSVKISGAAAYQLGEVKLLTEIETYGGITMRLGEEMSLYARRGGANYFDDEWTAENGYLAGISGHTVRLNGFGETVIFAPCGGTPVNITIKSPAVDKVVTASAAESFSSSAYPSYDADDPSTYTTAGSGQEILNGNWRVASVDEYYTWYFDPDLYQGDHSEVPSKIYLTDDPRNTNRGKVLEIERAGDKSTNVVQWQADSLPSLAGYYKFSFEFYRAPLSGGASGSFHPVRFNFSADGKSYYEINNYAYGGRPFQIFKVVNGAQKVAITPEVNDWRWCDQTDKDTWIRAEITVNGKEFSYKYVSAENGTVFEQNSGIDETPIDTAGAPARFDIGNGTDNPMYLDNFKLEIYDPFLGFDEEPSNVMYRDAARNRPGVTDCADGAANAVDFDPELMTSYTSDGSAYVIDLGSPQLIRKLTATGLIAQKPVAVSVSLDQNDFYHLAAFDPAKLTGGYGALINTVAPSKYRYVKLESAAGYEVTDLGVYTDAGGDNSVRVGSAMYFMPHLGGLDAAENAMWSVSEEGTADPVGGKFLALKEASDPVTVTAADGGRTVSAQVSILPQKEIFKNGDGTMTVTMGIHGCKGGAKFLTAYYDAAGRYLPKYQPVVSDQPLTNLEEATLTVDVKPDAASAKIFCWDGGLNGSIMPLLDPCEVSMQ